MNRYYDEKFNSLQSLEYTSSDALNEVIHFYLDDKPKKLKNENISQDTRDRWFWNSQLLQNYKDEFIKLDIYALALSKNLKSQSMYQIDIVKHKSPSHVESIKQAIRYSKIFLGKENKNYMLLKELLDIKIFEDFFIICDAVAESYNSLKDNVENHKNSLMNYGYADLLFIMSLSSLKYAYQNANNLSYLSIYGMVLTKILRDRIEQKDRRKKEIDERYIREKIIKYFMHNTHTYEVPKECDAFEKIFKAYEALINFEQNKLYTFLYDDNYQYTLLEDRVILNPIDMNKHIKTEMHSEKLQGMFLYYEEEALIVLENTFEKEYSGKKENYDVNYFQTLSVYQMQFIMSEIFGLDKNVFIDDDKTLNVFHLIYQGSAHSSLYAFKFLGPYLSILEKYGMENWKQSHIEIMAYGMLKHSGNRMPLIYKTIDKVVSEIEENQQIDFGEKIIDFWSHDLKENTMDSIKYPTFFEKPFIKIDDFVFLFPWLMSFSGTSPMMFINSLLRVHTNRMELLENGKKNNVRKDEVCRSEKNLAELFKKLGFKVEDGYSHSKEASDYGVQDMDIVASKDGHLFILELKSTYIRESIESNWVYKTGALRKAGHQLKKRKRYIEKLLARGDKDFIEKFDRPEHIHTWIVDTSFESDHEYFSDSLKVSMFEMMYALNAEYKDFYPYGFDIDTFIANIESEKLLDKLQRPVITKDEATYTISLR